MLHFVCLYYTTQRYGFFYGFHFFLYSLEIIVLFYAVGCRSSKYPYVYIINEHLASALAIVDIYWEPFFDRYWFVSVCSCCVSVGISVGVVGFVGFVCMLGLCVGFDVRLQIFNDDPIICLFFVCNILILVFLFIFQQQFCHIKKK